MIQNIHKRIPLVQQNVLKFASNRNSEQEYPLQINIMINYYLIE